MEKLLSKDNSMVLRGMAILAIMYHNFLHIKRWGFSQENEMTFNSENADAFFSVISQAGPDIAFELVSFLGWVGVPVFVFLTGYGLAIKHPPHSRIEPCIYLKHSYLKLFFLLFPGVLFFAIFDFKNGAWGNILKRIVEMTMLYNFDYPHLRVSPGVYWYFSLTFQYYILYYLFKKHFRPFNLLLLSIMALALKYILVLSDMDVVRSIYMHCFPGWFPWFAVGVWLAGNKAMVDKVGDASYPLAVFAYAVSAYMTVVLNKSHASWIFVPITGFIAFILLERIVLPMRRFSAVIKWVGQYSAFVFVCHPIARQFINSLHVYEYGLNVSLVVYTALTFILAYFYRKGYDYTLKYFKI